jgi:transcriptional regulator of acetoin/glycerol metabolism
MIERLSQEAADLPLSIALTDGKARILTRTDTDRTIGARLEKVDFAPGFDYAEGGVGTNGVRHGVRVRAAGAHHWPAAVP